MLLSWFEVHVNVHPSFRLPKSQSTFNITQILNYLMTVLEQINLFLVCKDEMSTVET